MLINNDRLSHWYAISILGGLGWFFVVWLPVFHFLFKFPIAGIALCAASLSVGQLVVTPWLFSARETAQNPKGRIGQRCVAIAIWVGLSMELLLLYAVLARPSHSGREFLFSCMAGSPVFIALVVYVAYKTCLWMRPIKSDGVLH
jgi:hypothetical protein